MEIEQAHRLYQEFQKTNEGARRKQGLGFGSSAVTSPPRRQVAPQPVAELLTAAPAIAASHRRGRQHDDAQIFEWSLDSGQQAIAGHGDAPAALPSQSPDAERKPEGAAAQEAAAKGGPEPDGRLRTAAAREDDRRRTPEDNRPSKRRQDAGPSDQRSHARDKTRSRERSSDTRRWRRTAGSPARRDDEHRRRRSPSDEPRRPHGDDARNGKWQLEDSRRGESDRRHEERRPAGRDRDERRDGDQRERRRRRSSSRCSSPRRHSRSPRRRSRSPRRRGRSPQRRGYSPRRRSPSPRRRGPSSRQHSRSPQRRGRSREYSPDTRRRRTPADRSDRQPHRAPGHRCGGSRSPDGSRDRWRANGAGVDDGRHRPREDAVRDSDRDRRSNGGFHSASDSRPVQRVDFASVIEGYDQMTPAQRLKAQTRYMLAQQTAKATDTGGGQWTRLDLNSDALLEEEGAAPDMRFEELREGPLPVSRLAARHDASHEDAIFGRPTQASNAAVRAAKPHSNGQLLDAEGDEGSDDAPVIVDASELGEEPRLAEAASDDNATPAAEPALSWREKALLLRQQRQANV